MANVGYFVYSKEGVSLGRFPPLNPTSSSDNQTTSLIDGSECCKTIKYSPNGSLLAWSSGNHVSVLDALTGKEMFSLSQTGVIGLSFSPKASYLSTYKRYTSKVNNVSTSTENVAVWRVSDGATAVPQLTYFNKAFEDWEPQFTDDESLLGKRVSNQVQFFSGNDLTKGVVAKLHLPNIARFVFSPGTPPYKVAAFVGENKGAPAYVRIFIHGSYDGHNVALANKSFYKADKAIIRWNPQGTSLLISTQTEVDNTGKSYEGETNLYFMSPATSFDCIVPLKKTGPIHDVAWSPCGREFTVVYGFMPAVATLFDAQCKSVHEWAPAHRNTVAYTPHGSVIVLAGFGNLRGVMEMYSRKELKLCARANAPDCTRWEISPDGAHFLTSSCHPRLRIENGYQFSSIKGDRYVNIDVKELYEVRWQPRPSSQFPDAPLVPMSDEAARAVLEQAKPQAYRPPEARGRASRFSLHDSSVSAVDKAVDKLAKKKGHVVGMAEPPSTELTKQQLKNQKKRKAKANAKAAESNNAIKPAVGTPGVSISEPAVGTPGVSTSEPVLDLDKSLKKMQKKLRQIELLKAEQAEGKQMHENQLEKIRAEPEIIMMVASLFEKGASFTETVVVHKKSNSNK